MKLLIILLLWWSPEPPDTVTLRMCTDSALKTHPTSEQLGMVPGMKKLQNEALNAGKLPKLSLNGQFNYQSEVIELPTESPGLVIPELPNERYRIYAEINQTLYNGGMTGIHKRIKDLQNEMKKSSVDKSRHKLKYRIIQLYFSSLLASRNKTTLDSTLYFLRTKSKTVKNAVENGVSSPKDLYKLKVKISTLENQRIQLAHHQHALLETLTELTGISLDTQQYLKIPSPEPSPGSKKIQRPELASLNLRQKLLFYRQNMKEAGNRPRVQIFVKGGGGYPNPYNFFDNEFSPFYLAGARFQWNLWDWGKSRKEMQKLSLEARWVEKQKETFLDQVKTELIRERSNIQKLEKTFKKKQNIYALKKKIRSISSAQLSKGTVSTTEYLDTVLEVTKAKMELDKTRIELSMVRMEYSHSQGLW